MREESTRGVMNRSLISFLLTLATAFALVFAWEFIVEPVVGMMLLDRREFETDPERWEYILTVTGFCFLALIVPTYWSFRFENDRDKVIEENVRLGMELKAALEDARSMGGLVTMCLHCHKVRDEDGSWDEPEAYVLKRSADDTRFSQGVCPDCVGEDPEHPDGGEVT